MIHMGKMRVTGCGADEACYGGKAEVQGGLNIALMSAYLDRALTPTDFPPGL